MFSLFIAVEGYQAMFDIKLIKGKNDLKKKKLMERNLIQIYREMNKKIEKQQI